MIMITYLLSIKLGYKNEDSLMQVLSMAATAVRLEGKASFVYKCT